MTPAIDFVGGFVAGVIVGSGGVLLIIGLFLWFAKAMGARSRWNTQTAIKEHMGNLSRQVSNCEDVQDRRELDAVWQFLNREVKKYE